MRGLILYSILFLSVTRLLSAQAVLHGVVTDEERIPIRDAAVVADAPATAVFYTDSTGRYVIPGVTKGDHSIGFYKFGWTTAQKKATVFLNEVEIDTVVLRFGNVDNDSSIDVKDVSLIHELTGDSVTNQIRYLDDNKNTVIDENEESKVITSVETESVPCPEWLVSKPDYVTFIPAVSNPQFATNQHYLVTKLKNGRLLGIWTAGYQESSDNQSMLCHWSDDGGRTWSKYVIIDGPQINKKIASWGFSIYVPERDRVYVFYNKDTGSRIYQQGDMYMKYTTNGGESWSGVYTYAFEPGEYTPKDGSPPYWWAYQNPIRVGNSYLVGFTEILPHEPYIFYSTEIRFMRFDNIQNIEDPNHLIITTFPSGGSSGLRGQFTKKDTTWCSTLQEPSVVQLSDGRLMCVMRSSGGLPYYSISTDSGVTWKIPEGLKFGDNLPSIQQPLASCPLYKIGNSSYVMIFHNNRGDANGGLHTGDGLRNRTPSFLLFGREDVSKKQPIKFGTPVRFLENYVRPYGPQKRTEIATYPSMTEMNGEYVLWYPDRKHFLLGKKIPKP